MFDRLARLDTILLIVVMPLMINVTERAHFLAHCITYITTHLTYE